MAEFLYVLRPIRPAMLTEGLNDAEKRVIAAHSAYLSGLTDRGVIVLAGRTQTSDPETMGLVIFEAEDDAAARAIMNADPAVAEGVMKATLSPYKIAFRRVDQAGTT